ncbi:MAG: hypothetical protein M0R77_17695 [Gammaproteobacteria bacterium]|nr:hypothetical protein [Gammaproteobacteria bacterium]
MVKLEINQLPNYPTRKMIPLMLDEDGKEIDPPKAYPIPDFEIVEEERITILDQSYQQLNHKLALKLIHFLYGPVEITSRFTKGMPSPRLFFKEFQKNNWIGYNQYGNPLTLFTSDIQGLNSTISNQMILSNSYVVDMQHPYCEQIMQVSKEYEILNWPWATLEISLDCVRKGDLILGQIQLYEIDLSVKYYIEIDDITPFTAYHLTR